MAAQFYGSTKLIVLPTGTISLSVRDLWSDWVRWHATSDNCKYFAAFRSLGGDPIDAAAGTYIPFYIYLTNGWRIRPQEANHTLKVTEGILLVEGGGDPFLPTLGGYTVQVDFQQPVQAISITAGGGTGLTEAGIADAVWAKLLANGMTAEANLLSAKQNAANAFAVST